MPGIVVRSSQPPPRFPSRAGRPSGTPRSLAVGGAGATPPKALPTSRWRQEAAWLGRPDARAPEASAPLPGGLQRVGRRGLLPPPSRPGADAAEGPAPRPHRPARDAHRDTPEDRAAVTQGFNVAPKEHEREERRPPPRSLRLAIACARAEQKEKRRLPLPHAAPPPPPWEGGRKEGLPPLGRTLKPTREGEP